MAPGAHASAVVSGAFKHFVFHPIFFLGFIVEIRYYINTQKEVHVLH